MELTNEVMEEIENKMLPLNSFMPMDLMLYCLRREGRIKEYKELLKIIEIYLEDLIKK